MADYHVRRAQVLAELTPEDRVVFDEAYAAAGLAMELTETAYRAREAPGSLRPNWPANGYLTVIAATA